ncbi:MAG: ABC transporter ATP-binding protein [Rhodospirillales bacterium]|jgi:peptide/nickel transport system ATP-binding protein|nr:ABC transporter ATP-binding protein [Rhodospirillales bacterium]
MADKSPPILEVRDLAVGFHTAAGEFDAVKGVSFDLYRGETLAILGESGSGKSVSASAVMGILDSPPGFVRGGEAYLDGENLLELSEGKRRELLGEKIAMIFQDTLAHLNPVYTIGWQIAECFRVHRGFNAKDARARAIDLLDRVGMPDPQRRAGDYPHQFSGGQRQRIMIAMALALEPAILIADEPTTALDVTVQAQILDLLIELRNERNMGLILITHDLGVVAEIADRMVVMNDGQIVEEGPVRKVFANPEHPYTKRLMGAIPGRGGFREAPATQDTGAPKPILEVRDLAKHYGITGGMFGSATGQVVKACDGVSFDLYAGETLGIVGESGSGKTTVANMLLRLTEPTRGSATLDGQDIFSLAGDDLFRLRRRFQAVFQDPFASLNPTMSVFDIISEPWLIHRDVMPKPRYRERVVELLEQVGMMADHADRYPHQFSGGQRQRIAVARALALEPEIIICDEAVSALDVSIQAQIIELLAELRDAFGLSYLFIAHDLPVVQELADRVIVMKSGKIVEQGTVAEIFANPKETYTIDLLGASPIPDPEQMLDRRQRRGIVG